MTWLGKDFQGQDGATWLPVYCAIAECSSCASGIIRAFTVSCCPFPEYVEWSSLFQKQYQRSKYSDVHTIPSVLDNRVFKNTFPLVTRAQVSASAGLFGPCLPQWVKETIPLIHDQWAGPAQS